MPQSEPEREVDAGTILRFPGSEPDRTSDLPSKTLWSVTVDPAATSVQWEPPRWEPPSLDVVAEMLSGFEVLGFLGRGGMGAVYQARQLSLDRLVAIKLLPSELSKDEGFRRRFLREAQTLGKLNHPLIVTLHDMGETEGKHLFLVMEYVEGTKVQDLINAKSLDAEKARTLMCDVCEALAYAHSRDVIHRDLKPANIIVMPEGRAKVVDFGISCWNPAGIHKLALTTNVLFGSQDYVAPEQRKSSKVDHRADIYAMGVTFYEMLCFDVPKGRFALPSERCGTNPAFDEIIVEAMQDDPDLRYATAQDMLKALSKVGVLALPKPQLEKSERRSPWLKWLYWTGIVATCAAVGISVPWLTRGKAKDTTFKPVTDQPTPSSPTQPSALPPKVQAHSSEWTDWATDGFAEGRRIETPLTIESESPAGKTVFFGRETRNQAIRILCRTSELGPRPYFRLIARSDENASNAYALLIQPKTWQVLFLNSPTQDSALCPPIKSPIQASDAEHWIELRTVGDSIACLFDDRELAKATNRKILRGRVGLNVKGKVQLRKVQWRSLDDETIL